MNAALVTLNDLDAPATGGDKVYAMIHGVLRERYRDVRVSTLRGTPLGYPALLTASASAKLDGRLVFTSSCPSFPLPGDATYHQPKGGALSSHARGERLDRRLACILTEHEELSPLWLLAKRGIRLHLANSEYTRLLARRLYGVEARVIYPAVDAAPTPPRRRRRSILVTKPERVSGVAWLPRALARAPRDAEAVIIGRIDEEGRRSLRSLAAAGARYRYLGYVSDEEKRALMEEASVHLNLVVNESFGLSTLEAAGHGAIPVAHRSGAPPEYLPAEQLYAEPEEAGEIIAQRIDASKEEREEARRIAARFTAERFRRELHGHLAKLEETLEAKP